MGAILWQCVHSKHVQYIRNVLVLTIICYIFKGRNQPLQCFACAVDFSVFGSATDTFGTRVLPPAVIGGTFKPKN